MAFKMKGPTFFNVGNEYEKQYPASAFQQRTGTEGQDQDKIFDDKGKHIGNWEGDKKVLFKKSPLEQAPGGGAGEAIEHWKKYKSKQKNIKELDKFLHGTSKSRAAQRALDAKKAKKAKGFSKTAKKVVKKAAKKSIIKKVGGKILSRFLPGVGWGLLAHDVIKTAPKVAKATKKSLKKQAKGQSVGFPKY